MGSDWQALVAAVAALVAVFTFAGIYYKGIHDLSGRITTLEADNHTFWRIIGPRLEGLLHSPHHARRDFLMERFFKRHEELSVEELRELHCLLAAEADAKDGAFYAALSQVKVEQTLNRMMRQKRWP